MKKILLISLIGLGLYANSEIKCKNIESKEERQKCFLTKKEHKAEKINAFKKTENVSHQGRINILTEADNCINNAKTREQYKNCERKEKEERENLRENIKQQRQQLK